MRRAVNALVSAAMETLVEIYVALLDAAVDPVRDRFGWLVATLMVLLLLVAIPIGLLLWAFRHFC
uniref:hypothetical protein n=1 Tax=Sphingomonas bacterium TaxID=1895847 RepID=UPI0026144871|nr:hypothetical protein [Sphingomonas bacterium]